jgi:hypothetical protein
MDTKVTTNAEQRLYVIPAGHGYSCLGFDVCQDRTRAYKEWLGEPFESRLVGSIEAYNYYLRTIDRVQQRCQQTHTRCTAELTPQLIGLENKRVEVETTYGETRRFYVGKSTGFIPIHLEIARRNSSGGPAAMGPYKSVRVVGTR